MPMLLSRFYCLGLCAALMLAAAGCASTNVTAPGEIRATYEAEAASVYAAAAETIRTMGLGLTDRGKINASTYHLIAYQMARMRGTRGTQKFRAVNLDIYIKETGPEQTRVRIEAREATVAYGSSLPQDPAEGYARDLIGVLNDKFPSAS